MAVPLLCTSQPMTLLPGEWLIQYAHTIPLAVRTHGGGKIMQLRPFDSFILNESDALKFLAFMQQTRPELSQHFIIVERYAT